MPSVNLHPRSITSINQANSSLPDLLQTPSGLAILEIQGTLNAPVDTTQHVTDDESRTVSQTPIGRLVFPFYHANASPSNDTAWMKRVYLYIGKHQRLTGEVKKLSKPLAVVRKRENHIPTDGHGSKDGVQGSDGNELEIAEVVHYKILFSSRPEPVGE